MKKGRYLSVIILCILILGLVSYYTYNRLSKKDKTHEDDDKPVVVDEVPEEDTFDYSVVPGTYTNSEYGVTLNIDSISENDIVFSIIHKSDDASYDRIAQLGDNSMIELLSIENKVYNFNWDEDGFGSTGSGNIQLKDDKVYLTIKAKPSEENKSGWTLGDYDNILMEKNN